MTDTEEYLDALRSRVRFTQFVSVGVIGATSDLTVLAILHGLLGVPEVLAKAVGIETAILVMFTINDRWTFVQHRRSGQDALLRRLLRSHLVRAGGSSVQLVLYWLLIDYAAITLLVFGNDLWWFFAAPVAIGIAMLVNYVFESLFTWKVHVGTSGEGD